MKNILKRAVTTMLLLAVLITCLPTTAYAKEPYKWQKSLTLTGKQYKNHVGDDGIYVYLVYVDRDTKVTVQNNNGAVSMYCPRDSYGYDDLHCFVDFVVRQYPAPVCLKKNKKITISLDKGLNMFGVERCSNTVYKSGASYSCKVISKDANLCLLNSCQLSKSYGLKALNYKDYTKLCSWVDPQIASLSAWGTHKNRICSNLAEAMIKGGFSSKKKATLAKEIDKAVENAVQKSKEKNIKIINHEEAVLQYIDSVDGLKAWMQETYKGSAKEMTYWDSFKDMTDGLLYDMKDYYMGNK